MRAAADLLPAAILRGMMPSQIAENEMAKSPSRASVIQSVIATVDDAIARVGWGVIAVGADAHAPSFAYTVGLTATFRHPELLLMGFAPQMMQGLLNGAAARVKGGVRFGDWSSDDKVVANYPVWFRQVAAKDAPSWARVADCRYGGDLTLLQMFLPDEKGLFPWDEGVKHAYAVIQGRLLKGMAVRTLS